MENTKKKSITVLFSAARLYLSGEILNDISPFDLGKELKNEERYAYAAEVFLKHLGECPTMKERKEVLKELSFCFYKDPDLPSALKFSNAIKYLTEIDNIEDTLDYEVLGKLGAVYKNKWYYDNQFSNLIYSRHFYYRGYKKWKEAVGLAPANSDEPYVESKPAKDLHSLSQAFKEDTDDGYNAINYAFILDLMAKVRLHITADLTEDPSDSAKGNIKKAKQVRNEIIENLENLIKNSEQKPKPKIEKWVFATLGEAYFGIDNYEQAELNFGKYAVLAEPWETETTAKQLVTLAELKVDLNKILTNRDIKKYINEKDKDILKKKNEDRNLKILEASKKCLLKLYAKESIQMNQLPNSLLRGKVGLGLSGGGFRASLYHIGTLAALAELDVLRHVEVLSCVSGGSIAGAYYYLKLKKLLETKYDGVETSQNEGGRPNLSKEDYITLVKEMEEEFLKGVQTNIRMQIISDIRANIKIFVTDRDYTRTAKLAELYEDVLYKKINGSKKDILIHELKITPLEIADINAKIEDPKQKIKFNPNKENWLRWNKVPVMVLNATSLNTGHNWQFTASWMGEPPANINYEIDSKPRLRRMYYNEAPPPYRNNIRLGTAVGSSSCVPALFTPVMMPNLYEGIDLMLVDGGVHDNQGIASLLEQECKLLIISDACGQLPTNPTPSSSIFGSFFQSDSIFQERIRESQFLDIKKRVESGQIKAALITHLKRDLQENPIKWTYCEDPTRKIWLNEHSGDNVSRTSYGVLKEVQRHLANIRTDLDAFSDVEAYSLMYSAYRQTKSDFRKQGLDLYFTEENGKPDLHSKEEAAQEVKTDNPAAEGVRAKNPNGWKFMGIEDYMINIEKSQKIIPILETAKDVPFKVLKTNVMVRSIAIVVGLCVLALLGVILLLKNGDAIMIKYVTLAIIALLFIADRLISPYISKLFGIRSSLIRKFLLFIFAVILALLSKFYLNILNKMHLKYGSMDSLEKTQKSARGIKVFKFIIDMLS